MEPSYAPPRQSSSGADGCAKNPNPCKITRTLKNQRKRAPPHSTASYLEAAADMLPNQGACCSHCPSCPVLTCVSAKMGLEMGTFEVGLPAAREAANIVSPPGEVYLRGTVLAGGNEQWSRGKGQQLGVPNSHDTGWAGSRLG